MKQLLEETIQDINNTWSKLSSLKKPSFSSDLELDYNDKKTREVVQELARIEKDFSIMQFRLGRIMEHAERVYKSLEEIQHLKGTNHFWVVRDKHGGYYSYRDKPNKTDFGWEGEDPTYITEDILLEKLSNVKWKDEEPALFVLDMVRSNE